MRLTRRPADGQEEAQEEVQGRAAPAGRSPISCTKGKFGKVGTAAADHDAAADCVICPKGTYVATAAQVKCIVCPAGTYLKDTVAAAQHDALSDCIDCPKGTYLIDTATAAAKHDALADCTNCASGKYKDVVKQVTDTCISCPLGMYGKTSALASNHDGFTDCKLCSAGKYAIKDTLGRAVAVHRLRNRQVWQGRDPTAS